MRSRWSDWGKRSGLAALLLAVSLVFGSAAHAADAPNRWEKLTVPLFEHLTLEHGLPHPVTVAMTQDAAGYLWFGTQRGLARWDGYQMRSFRFDANDPHSLPADFIYSLHVDRQDRLWVGTASAGVAMFDKATERFIRYPVGGKGLSEATVLAIASDARGGVWVGTLGGLNYIDTARGTISAHLRDGPGNNQIRSLLVDRRGDLWIGSAGGLAFRSAAGGKAVAVAASDASAPDAVLSIGENERGQIVFGTLKSGIGVVDADARSTHTMKLGNVTDPANVRGIAHIAPGRWWAASYGGGIIEFDPDSGRNHRISHRPAVPTSLGHDRVTSLLRDRSGLVWVAHERGVDFYNPYNRTFESVFDGEGLPEISVTAFMRDARNRIWIALADQGIDIVEADGTRSKALRPDPLQLDTNLPSQLILAMAEAEPGEAWIGTPLGLYHSTDLGRKVKRVPLPLPNPYPRIGSILVQGQTLWLGTVNGLLQFDTRAGTVKKYAQGAAKDGGISHNVVVTAMPAPDGRLWVGTWNGLNRLDPATGTVEQFKFAPNAPNGLSDPVVGGLTLDRRGRLWVGTHGGGIDVFDTSKGGLQVLARIGTAQGLPVPVVAGLSDEQDGKIWVATTNGLAVVDTSTLRARPFGRADGLALQPYFINTVLASGDGELLMGSSGGFTIVRRAAQASWAYRPAVVLSSIRLDGAPLSGAQQLAASARGLVVAPGVKSIEVEAAALDFSATKRNRYSFWLEGYDKSWVELEPGRRVVSYGNLAPGEYRLRIRGSNREGAWSSNETALTLSVQPAWHQTRWAYLGFALAALAFAWAVYHLRLRQLQASQVRLQALVALRTARLEKLHAIVKSINEQLDVDLLLQAILRESAFLRGVDAARALVRVIGSEQLATRARWVPAGDTSADSDDGMTMDQADARLVQHAQAIDENIYLKPQPVGAVLSVRICIGEHVHGYLVFENHRQDGRFDADDLDLLKALKEPFVSAFQKAHAMHQLDQARANAVAATRAKSDFLANISHEIRTPMNAILGFAGLGTHLELPPQPLDYFRKIGRAGQNLLGIINDVLDFSKIEAGKLELETVPFDLHDTLNQIADMFAWRAAEKGLELVVWAEPGVPGNLVGDPLRLSQVLTNLVGNALKFTSAGFVQLHVALDDDASPAANRTRTRLRFTVEDSGVGLSKEQMERLFQAFVQADTSTTRVYGGTGLGLAISQQLVAKMGGTIEVDSTLARGSRFAFSVDLLQQSVPAGSRWEAPEAARGKTILVVDDSPPTREVLLLQLRNFGFDASAVGSGAAALLALQLRPHDLVLMDWNMPDMDGIEATRQIKNHPGLTVIPTVIMVTAFDRDHIKAAAGQAGVDAFLIKPVNPFQLLNGVLAALGFEADLPVAVAVDAPSASSLHIAGTRVLVVDDNAINQQVAGDILQRAGVVVDFADSGVDAVRMVDQASYDAVLMDIQMPDMDGYQATAIIREKTPHVNLPIIAMTAHAMAGYREHVLSKGINDYLSKPIEPDLLYEVLAKWTRSLYPSMHPPAAPAYRGDAAAAAIAGIDLPGALSRLGGNKQLLAHLLAIFVEDFTLFPPQIREHIVAGQFDSAAQLVHKIRGAAGNLSANALYRTAGELEKLLLSGSTERLDERLLAFAADVDTVLASARLHADSGVPAGLQN